MDPHDYLMWTIFFTAVYVVYCTTVITRKVIVQSLCDYLRSITMHVIPTKVASANVDGFELDVPVSSTEPTKAEKSSEHSELTALNPPCE